MNRELLKTETKIKKVKPDVSGKSAVIFYLDIGGRMTSRMIDTMPMNTNLSIAG